MTLFRDRLQAGELLAEQLKSFQKDPDAVVLGLPRGGVVTAYAVAKALSLPLDILCLRKIGAPHNPELAIGAISASGETFYNERLIEYLGVSPSYLSVQTELEKKRAQARLSFYRKIHPEINLDNKTAILIDDGLATGATMHAAVATVQAAGASRIIVAVPVAAQDSLEELKPKVDALIYLEAPLDFQAVGQFYDSFDQVEDEEVVVLLKNLPNV